jgi:hypothetical protein
MHASITLACSLKVTKHEARTCTFTIKLQASVWIDPPVTWVSYGSAVIVVQELCSRPGRREEQLACQRRP